MSQHHVSDALNCGCGRHCVSEPFAFGRGRHKHRHRQRHRRRHRHRKCIGSGTGTGAGFVAVLCLTAAFAIGDQLRVGGEGGEDRDRPRAHARPRRELAAGRPGPSSSVTRCWACRRLTELGRAGLVLAGFDRVGLVRVLVRVVLTAIAPHTWEHASPTGARP